MVFDSIKNVGLYFNMNERIQKALKFISENDFEKMDDGNVEIDGDKVFAIIQSYETKAIEKGRWEAHRKYIDVQYVADGYEKMGYTDLDNTEEDEEYNAEIDLIWLKGKGNFIKAKKGSFAVFYPQDAHMPGIAVDNPVPVKKVVVKVLV